MIDWWDKRKIKQILKERENSRSQKSMFFKRGSYLVKNERELELYYSKKNRKRNQ